MIKKALTSKYKKASNNIKQQINIDEKRILKNKEALNRLEIKGENSSVIILKDQKENFNNDPTIRLINPAKKNKLGRISKAILDRANNLRETMNLNL